MTAMSARSASAIDGANPFHERPRGEHPVVPHSLTARGLDESSPHRRGGDVGTESPGRIFDLSHAPSLIPRGWPIGRMIVLGLFLILFVALIGLVIYRGFRGDPFGTEEAGLVILTCAILAMFGYAYFAMGPGPNRCVWSADSFTLQYSNGRIRAFRWDDPRLCFEISEIHYEDKVEYDLASRMPWHNDVTPELYAAILAEARSRGLEVRSRVTGTPAQRIITNRILSQERVRA